MVGQKCDALLSRCHIYFIIARKESINTASDTIHIYIYIYGEAVRSTDAEQKRVASRNPLVQARDSPLLNPRLKQTEEQKMIVDWQWQAAAPTKHDRAPNIISNASLSIVCSTSTCPGLPLATTVQQLKKGPHQPVYRHCSAHQRQEPWIDWTKSSTQRH
jgi:hypothetical protein